MKATEVVCCIDLENFCDKIAAELYLYVICK